MAFDRSQAEAVFERALELDAPAASTFDRAALQRLADELGVSESAMSRAIDEALAGRPGPLNAVAEAEIAASAPEIHEALGSYFRLRGLRPNGPTVWQQESGWWPDLYRFTATTAVAVSIREGDDRTTVRLTARLDRLWRVHLAAALMGPLLLLGGFIGVGPSVTVGSLVAVLLWVGAAAWTYQQRRQAVGRRLGGALTDVARPAYRLQPW